MAAAAGAGVVVGDDRRAALDMALAPRVAPELVAAVAAFQDAGQQPSSVAMPGPATSPAAFGHHHLGLVPVLAADDDGHCVGHDEPFIPGRPDHLGLTDLALALRGTAVLDAVELGLGPAVPDEVAPIRRVLQHGLDRGEAPDVSYRARDALGVERRSDGGEAQAVQAHSEDILDHLNTGRIRQHQPGLAFLAGLGQRLALGVGGLEFAVLVIHLAHAARAEADAEQHRAVGREDFAVVAVGRCPAGVGLALQRTELAPQYVLRQADGVLAVLELLDGAEHVAVDAVPGEVVLRDRQHLHVGLPQQVAIVLGLGHVAPREPVAVPDGDGPEVAPSGVGDHALESGPLVGRRAANGVVHVLADDPVVVLLGVALYLEALVIEALLLLVRRAAKVRNGRDGIRGGDHGVFLSF